MREQDIIAQKSLAQKNLVQKNLVEESSIEGGRFFHNLGSSSRLKGHM